MLILLAEVALEQAFERAAMAGLIAGHQRVRGLVVLRPIQGLRTNKPRPPKARTVSWKTFFCLNAVTNHPSSMLRVTTNDRRSCVK